MVDKVNVVRYLYFFINIKKKIKKNFIIPALDIITTYHYGDSIGYKHKF